MDKKHCFVSNILEGAFTLKVAGEYNTPTPYRGLGLKSNAR